MSEELNTSSTSDQNAEESDVTTLTLNEVLELENEAMEDAAAVLGAASDKNCSYSDGYVKRQALYSCLTCCPEAKNDCQKGAGICLACSYHCHEGHELIELYTKRNFRCDCGNAKFNGIKCNLFNSKSDNNEFNSYNQNFSGLYCECHKPYPDPDDSQPDEMIQCIVCEDWYHSRHLGTDLPESSYAEMICSKCVAQHLFLLHYNNASAENASQDTNCKKPLEKSDKVTTKFFGELSWRQKLCTCIDCLDLYKSEKVLFLIDTEDPVHVYEEKGKAKTREIVESHDRKFMNSMDRVQLGEMVAGYNDLKENLAEYLKKFAENKKVVKEEDIKEFFEGMNARKKQKVGVPYLCH